MFKGTRIVLKVSSFGYKTTIVMTNSFTLTDWLVAKDVRLI